MIHLAMVILAIIIIFYGAMFLLNIGLSGFGVNKGCGCMTMILAGAIALGVMMYAC